ncbi:WbqC-like protein [Lacibacter cauensis]|uniref:WbqC-like protein n=1 Tax=Lacibacter cauensis TaxID=510947 RepID=A0A562SUW4_9BACT|nr:WbqC family protein [Lacibacter cauensis]TWI85042.1 WbqC-like protein [Lacibacter cauensis]
MIDLHYFGDIYSYLKFIQRTNVEFSPYQNYQRASKLNRMRLMGANGPLLLSVPLEGGRDQQVALKGLRISYAEPWQRIHWRGIHDNYRKAPWFEDYAPGLESLYRKREKFLLDLNLKTTEWAVQRLKLKVDFLAVEREQDLLKQVQVAKDSGQPKTGSWPVYQQVFGERHGFVPNLSIVDLLLCEGPMAINYLKKIAL